MRTPCFFSFSTCEVKWRWKKPSQKKPTRKWAPRIGILAEICSLGNQWIEPLAAHSFRKHCGQLCSNQVHLWSQHTSVGWEVEAYFKYTSESVKWNCTAWSGMKLGSSTPKLQQRNFTDIRSSLQKPLDYRYQSYKIKWLKEILTLKQEMKTDDDDAAMRESFSLVQNIVFIGYSDVLLA